VEKPNKPPLSAEEAAKAEAGTDATIVGEAGTKNVRSGPGTNYDAAHASYPGDRVKILATSRDDGGYTWKKVYFPKSGAEGWMAAQFLRNDGEGDGDAGKPMEAEPPVRESKPPTSSSKTSVDTNATITGEPGSKNVRSGPGMSYASPHMAYPGDRVQITSTTQDKNGFTWYKVYFPKSGAEGWMAAQLVSPD
jgi:serine/threonine protein kinase, bacterial